MAVPELGQIRIVPDYFNWQIAKGISLSAGSQTVTTGTIYDMFDHRPLNRAIWDTSGETQAFTISGGESLTGKWMCIIEGHNLVTADTKIGIASGGTSIATMGCSLNANVNYVNADADEDKFAIENS